MPVQREVRYLSPNDVGKVVTYSNPGFTEVIEDGDLLLGGRLMDLKTEAEWLLSTPLCSEREVKELGRLVVKLNIDDQWVAFAPNDRVTVYGMDGD